MDPLELKAKHISGYGQVYMGVADFKIGSKYKVCYMTRMVRLLATYWDRPEGGMRWVNFRIWTCLYKLQGVQEV